MLAAVMVLAAASEPSVAYVGGKPGAASIIGRVMLEALPQPKKFTVTRYADKCGREKADQAVLYSADKGLRNVVVWIDNVRSGKDLVPEGVMLKNITCVYEPRVSAASTGSSLEIKNFDGLQLNTAGYWRTPLLGAAGPVASPWFSFALPVKGLTVKRRLDKPGLIDIRTEAGQPWMQAWVWVFDHPYRAVSDEGGYFSLDKVPAGEVTLNAWHETLGHRVVKIVVPESDMARADFQF